MTKFVTCTVNPAIDLATEVDRVEPSRKLRCSDAKRDPGGGGINVARVLRRLGADVTAVFTAGGLTGELLKTLVQREAIASVPIAVQSETREDVTVRETTSGREFRFVLPGGRLSDSECGAVVAAVANIPAYSHLVLSGSLPPGVPTRLYADIILAAKRSGALTALDSSGEALMAGLEGKVDVVKPNLRELRELTSGSLDNEADQIGAALGVIQSGRARMVALTRAEGGALLVAQDRVWRAAAPKVALVSSVGAGDSFLAALMWSLAGGQSPAEALRHGVAAGTAALLSKGTALAHEQDIERLMPAVTVESLAMPPA